MHCGQYSRRDFLRKGSVTLGAMALAARLDMLPALANNDGTGYKALVFIFLDGGNDFANTIVPLEAANYNFYSASRPLIALPQSGLLSIQPRSDARPYGLHPALTEVQGLFNTGKLACVVNMGNLLGPLTPAQYNANPKLAPAGIFAHDTMNQALQQLQSASASGWGQGVGNYVKGQNVALRIPMYINVGGSAGIYLAGSDPYITLHPGSAPTLSGFGSDPVSTARYSSLRNILRLNNNSALVNVLGGRLSDAIDQGQLLSNILGTTSLTTSFLGGTINNLGPQLQQIAKLIKARANLSQSGTIGDVKRQIFFASVPGYDTHGGQLSGQNGLLRELSASLKNFYDSTVELGVSDQVTTFALSEFGRTTQCSGDGSDHGWGGAGLVMGDSVIGGDFYGTYPSLQLAGPNDADQSVGARGRLLPTTSVDQFAGTIAKWFGLSASSIQTAFPNIRNFNPDLGFMKP